LPEVRKYLFSDAAEEEKKSNIMMYRNHNGWTCLHRACHRDTPDDIMKAMLDIGGKELVMKTTNYDSTVLHFACMKGASFNIINMLIEVGGKDLVMAKNKGGNTALHYLCRLIKRHARPAKKIKLILQVGDANLLLSTKDYAGQTPLEIADDMDASSEIKKLLKLQSTTLIKKE
jgi:ankyrin repeat protein